MCVLSTLCGNVDKHSPFDIYIYIYISVFVWERVCNGPYFPDLFDPQFPCPPFHIIPGHWGNMNVNRWLWDMRNNGLAVWNIGAAESMYLFDGVENLCMDRGT